MYAEILSNASFPEVLLALDRELARETKQRGCPRCGGVLDTANYRRKPRGGPFALQDSQCCRLSLRRAAAAIDATVESVQEAPVFRRFSLQRGEDVTLVDLVIDRAPQLVEEKATIGRVRIDSEREIAANKITALLGRTAPRDLVDLFALFGRGHTLEAALADARLKDGAVDPATLAWVLSQWRLGPNVPLPVGVALDDIERMRAQLIERLLALAVPNE